MNWTRYRLAGILFLPFLPVLWLTGYLAEFGCRALFDSDKPEFTIKNVMLLLVFIVLSPLILASKPIQKTYIRHLKERER